jgi:hypothetical protein
MAIESTDYRHYRVINPIDFMLQLSFDAPVVGNVCGGLRIGLK